MIPASDDRELRGDKGQTCERCGEHFKYQYLYDDHYPCRARALDPTTAAIEARVAGRDRLRSEVARLPAIVEAEFRKGYDQAVREIRDHFAKEGDRGTALVIERIWKIAFEGKS